VDSPLDLLGIQPLAPDEGSDMYRGEDLGERRNVLGRQFNPTIGHRLTLLFED